MTTSRVRPSGSVTWRTARGVVGRGISYTRVLVDSTDARPGRRPRSRPRRWPRAPRVPIASANLASTRMSARSMAGIGQQVDPRPVDDGVVVGTRERRARRRRARRRAIPVMSPNSARSVGCRWTTKRFGTSVRSVVVRRSPSIARSIRSLDLDRLETCSEEPCRGALKEAFEEPLDGGERRHGRSRSLPEGPSRAPTLVRLHPDVRRIDRGTPGGRALEIVRYTLDPLGRHGRPERSPREYPGTR